MKFSTFSSLLLFSLASARPSLRQRINGPQNGIDVRDVNNDDCGTASHAPMPTPTSGSGSNSSSGAQMSLTLLPSVVSTNFSQNGLNTSTSGPGEVASLTSKNNFINWCATLPHLPITNGRQMKNGSCNPAPMGAIPSTSNMPSVKFVTPVNLAVVPANTTFRVTVATKNLASGYFANPNTNYLAAPQQLDPKTGHIQGHAHIVIQALESFNQTTPIDPTKFAFFLALNNKADAKGYLHANVTGGLPKGVYRMSTLVSSTNHQPVVLPTAERGVSDDTIYFTVSQSTNATAIPAHTHHVTPATIPMATPTASTGDCNEVRP